MLYRSISEYMSYCREVFLFFLMVESRVDSSFERVKAREEEMDAEDTRNARLLSHSAVKHAAECVIGSSIDATEIPGDMPLIDFLRFMKLRFEAGSRNRSEFSAQLDSLTLCGSIAGCKTFITQEDLEAAEEASFSAALSEVLREDPVLSLFQSSESAVSTTGEEGFGLVPRERGAGALFRAMRSDAASTRVPVSRMKAAFHQDGLNLD